MEAHKLKQTKEEKKKQQQAYYQRTKKIRNEYYAKRLEIRRQSILKLLGNICADCGESDSIVLQIGHIYDDGVLDRQKFKNVNSFYNHILSLEDTSSKFKLQCCNCNWRQEYYKRKGLKNAG